MQEIVLTISKTKEGEETLLITGPNKSGTYEIEYFGPSSSQVSLGLIHYFGPNGDDQIGIPPEASNGTTNTKLRIDALTVGTTSKYYHNLAGLPFSARQRILRALRDITLVHAAPTGLLRHPVLTRWYKTEQSWKKLDEYVKILRQNTSNGAILSSFEVSGSTHRSTRIEFNTRPSDFLPTHVHAIIGPNGVGKSTILNSMAQDIIDIHGQRSKKREERNSANLSTPLSKLIMISFNALDELATLSQNPPDKGFRSHYIGIKSESAAHDQRRSDGRTDGRHTPKLKSQSQLTLEFRSSLDTCLKNSRKYEELRHALDIFNNDPHFSTLQFKDRLGETAYSNSPILPTDSPTNTADELASRFPKLSAGHKAILLIVVRLISLIEDKSFILVDEPETNLHPPLLSGLVNFLQSLSMNYNSLCILATHSPVVLQELPRRCVWKLSRTGSVTVARRPRIETYGENVNRLTAEVLGKQVAFTGFSQRLTNLALETRDYDEALDRLGGEIGSEGRILLRSLFRTRDA